MEKIDVIEQAANRLLQHNVAEARWLNLYGMDLLTDIVDRNL